MEWKFRLMGRDEPSIDPIQEEFFSTAELEDLSSTLVRESIQNSLDARVGVHPVSVVFSFGCVRGSENALGKAPYFKSLVEHLRVPTSGLKHLPSDIEHLDYISIEDFHTNGLLGSIELYDDPDDDTENQDFYYFYRNVGRSSKGAARLGRWGLGKQVFPASSRINAFFGLTRRSGENKSLLMGQCVLKVHRIDGQRRCFPYGYFGVFGTQDAFAMPTGDEGEVSAFCETFKLQRGGESGLSVVVPYHQSEIQPNGVIKAVVAHYFHPILAGDLQVTVKYDGKAVCLTKANIAEEIERHLADQTELIAFIRFSQWSLGVPENEYEELPVPALDRTPRWKDVLMGDGQEERLRQLLTQNGRVAMRVPVKVARAGEPPQLAWFLVYLQLDDGLQGGEGRFIRQGINITQANPRMERGARGLVVIRDAVLSELLGDAEPPAHDKWDERSLKFRGKYDQGASVIRFVKNSLQELHRRLTVSADQKDTRLLQDVFYVDRESLGDEVAKKLRDKKKAGRTAEPPLPPPPPKPQFLKVEQLAGESRGFRVSSVPDSKLETVLVKVAYDVRKGSPLKNYHQFDFELGKRGVTVDEKGCEIVRCDQNEIEARISAPSFEITVVGFDQNRDLFIKAEGVRADE